MEDMRPTTLGEICTGNGGTIQTGPFGSQLHRSDYRDFGVPVIMPTNIRNGRIVLDGIAYIAESDAERLGRHRAKLGDIIFSRRGEVDKCAVVTEREAGWLCGTGCLLARINPSKADPSYVGYHINFDVTRLWLRQHAVGLVMPNLNTGILSRIPLAAPRVFKQRKIAAVLSAIDDKIELNRRMNETLEASARALFWDWFVDFGPTRAKFEGRPAYLAPDLWSLFPDRLGDDGVPEGWIADTLAAIAKLNPETWGVKDHPNELRYVDLSNTKWGYVEKVEPYYWADAPSRARRVLRPGDTIVGTVRPANGSYAYVGEPDLTGSTGFAVLRPTVERDRVVVWCAATSPENIERLAHLADGGAYPAVRPEAVLSTEIAVPSPEILSAFAQMVTPLLERIEANKIESRTLAASRDALLPKLMSGEIRVLEAEALAA